MKRWATQNVLAAFGLALAILTGGAARADVFGLVIGVDDYGGPEDLQGAVADARDVASALRTIGARDVVTLLNGDARRARIFSELAAIRERAKSGDLIVLHYAGHGSQEPIRPGDRDADGDGRNEDFILGGFRTLGDPGERVIDKEVIAWLAETGASGVKVLFVADSCHSGGMIRGTRPGVRTREIKIAPPGVDAVARNVRSIAINDPGLANVTFLAAVPRNRASPEVLIDGQPRGALSWAFARALEGGAAPGASVITQAQLQRFIVPSVIAMSEGQQLPQMYPQRGGDIPLVPLSGSKAPPALPALPAQGQVQGAREFGAIRPIALAVVGGAPPAAPPRNARFVSAGENPDLLWDVRTHVVSQRLGGIVAENVDAYDIDAIVAKWAALDLVKRAMAVNAPEMTLASGVKAYGRGDEVRVSIGGARQPYLTIFNLPPNGRVELLYPDPGAPAEASASWIGSAFEKNFYVDRPPFGAEHLVAIFSSAPLAPLHAALARMDDRREAIGLPEVLRDALSRPDAQAGVMPVYTSGQ